MNKRIAQFLIVCAGAAIFMVATLPGHKIPLWKIVVLYLVGFVAGYIVSQLEDAE